MGDLLLKTLPMFLTPAPIARFQRSRVHLRRRGGSNLWGLCRKISVGVSELDIIYSTESADGSVLFRFGTASEIAEYVASQKVLNVNDRLETESFEEVDDEVQDKNIENEDTVEGFVDEVLDTNLEMAGDLRENGVDCTSDSSDVLSGEKIISDGAVVSDAPCPDIISNVSVVEPSVNEDGDGSLKTGNLGVAENISCNEIDIESGFEKESSTLNKTSDSDSDLEVSLGDEVVRVEIISVFDENSECNSQKENVDVESSSSSADDFEGDVGKDNLYLKTSSVSDENSVGNTEKEFVIVESIISDDDLESYGRHHSSILVDKDNDLVAFEPDVIGSSSLKEASHYVDKEDIWSPSVVSEISILATDENIKRSDINDVPMAEKSDVSSYDTDSNGNTELSAIRETRISYEELESDDKEILVHNGSLTFDEEMACDSDKEYVALQKTTLSEVIHNEDPRDCSSLLINSLDAVSVAERPSADVISNQKNNLDASDASGSPSSSFAGEGDFSHESSDETNMRNLDTAVSATGSAIIKDTDGSNSIAVISVASQPYTELILDKRKDLGIEEGFLSTIGTDSLNLTDEKATQTTEVIEVSEADVMSKGVATLSVYEVTEQIPAPAQLVADREGASPVRFCLSIGAALLPQTLEPLTAGEDAYFIAGEAWFGVADGVGQWSLEGTDAGFYGHELMECCRRIVSNGGCPPSTNPKEVLSRSAAEATSPGSATVLVAYFDGQVLHASNIGDTGFVIVRNGVVLCRSLPTVHDFHFPLQIRKGDDPLELVECYEIELDEGDAIIAATDGLFDNMYDQEIASVVTKSLQANMSPEEVAAVLAVKSQEIGTSTSTSTRTPFADAAQAAGYAGYTGGKLDDVAVLVSVVQKKSHI
ncbi:unnamed protein product [Rhodiola kirilowii]